MGLWPKARKKRNGFAMTKVILIAGLPGSGKSTCIDNNYPDDKYKRFDDYKNKAINLKFNSSRHFEKLIENLKNSNDCVLSDIDFCDPKSRTEAQTFLEELVPEATIQWIFFENNPVACRNNLDHLSLTNKSN
jgi:G3E family GTPase